MCAGSAWSPATPLPIFPGAQGFGTTTVAGSGRNLDVPCTSIIRVTNLNAEGSGSLRACAEARGPRVCIFETGGVITLPGDGPIRIKHPNLTIAGQTAPYPGIILRGAGIRIEASDVLLQHVSIRVGDDPTLGCCAYNSCSSEVKAWCSSEKAQPDGLSIDSVSGPLRHVVIDHVSVSWALDEGLSVVPSGGDITDVTVSNVILASALDDSIHPKVTAHLRAKQSKLDGHSMGVLVSGARTVSNLSFHHSLLAHNAERNIRVGSTASIEFINNIIYGWGRGAGVAKLFECTNSETNPAVHTLDIIGNRYEPGPDSYCPETTYHPYRCANSFDFPYLHLEGDGIDTPEERATMHRTLRVGLGLSSGLNAASRYFLADSVGPTRLNPSADVWDLADTTFFTDATRQTFIFPENRSEVPVSSSGSVSVHSLDAAWEHVLGTAGSRPVERDAVDAGTVHDVRTGTGRIINCVAPDGNERCAKNAGGWPVYPETVRSLDVPANPLDDEDADGYSNLEEWLHAFAIELEQVGQ